MSGGPENTQVDVLHVDTGEVTTAADNFTHDVLEAVDEYFSSEARNREFGDPPSRSFILSNYFDIQPLDELEVKQSYWLNKPYAYASVLFDESEDKNRYHYFEPELTTFEQYVRQDLQKTIRHLLREQSREALQDTDQFERQLESIIADHAATVDSASLYKIFYYLKRDFLRYDKLDPLIRDPHIEDISCDGANVPVFVHHEEFDVLQSNLTFESDKLDSFVFSLAQRANKHVSASNPQVSGNLPDGSRVQLTIDSDITMRGSNFTIRKFEETPYTPIDLIELGTFSLEEMAFIWLAIENNLSIMFVGPTASGKTTSMNAVSLFLPPDGKVVSIEQVRELSVPHDNWVSYVTRQARESATREEITMYDLLQSALHERPQYILVGEIRTNPVVVRTFFQSIFTGHPGGTTFHASTAQNAINRLTSEPLDITEQMASALDLISVQHQITEEGSEIKPRRNLTLSEVRSPEERGENLDIVDIYEWNPERDEIEQSMQFLQNSRVLQQISQQQGIDIETVMDEIGYREEVLAYMVENGMNSYPDVIKTIFQFNRNQDRVLEQVRSGTLSPSHPAPNV